MTIRKKASQNNAKKKDEEMVVTNIFSFFHNALEDNLFHSYHKMQLKACIADKSNVTEMLWFLFVGVEIMWEEEKMMVMSTDF